MFKVLLTAWIFDVEVTAVSENILRGNFPGTVGFFPFFPPGEAFFKFLLLHRHGFGVLLPAFGQGLFVIPHVLCRDGSIKEQEIGRNAGVGRKHAIGQTDDRVKVKVFQQFFFDTSADAIAE